MRVGWVVLSVVLSTGLLYSQKTSRAEDVFVTDPALRNYLDQTPYQHGALHGYEDGYQIGDVDFHLQRPQPEFKKVKEFRAATRGYVEGDRDEYRAGYQDGYLSGYQDGVSGRPFVALVKLEAAAENKPVTVAEAVSDGDDSEQMRLATFAPPSTPLKVPTDAIFLAQQAPIQPPEEERAAKDSVLARIMNNLRRTFMPAVITPQAVVTPQAATSGTPQ